MKTIILRVTFLVAIALTVSVRAENNIQYNYLDFRLIADAEIEDSNIDGDGFAFGGSVRLDELIYLFADYEVTDFDSNVDVTVLQGGVGALLSVNKIDLLAELALVDFDADGRSSTIASYDGTGYRFSAGARGYLNPQLELRAMVSRVDVDDFEDTFLTIAGDYFLNESFSVNLSRDINADIERFSIGLRYYLGE
ncbi:MAG: hypothetical protein ACJA04_000100 [Cellvibrionaceae bacterium]|jgi:hypothetical protein